MAKSLRFLLQSAKVNLSILAAFAGVLAAGAFATGVPAGADNRFSTYYGLFPLMSVMCLFLFAFAHCTSNLQLALSFGARRRDYFLALQGYMGFSALVCSILQAILAWIPQATNWVNSEVMISLLTLGSKAFWVFPFLCLTVQCIGGMVGLLFFRSRILGALILVFFMTFAIAATVVIMLEANHQDFLLLGDLPAILSALLTAGAVAGEWVMWRKISHFAVK